MRRLRLFLALITVMATVSTLAAAPALAQTYGSPVPASQPTSPPAVGVEDQDVVVVLVGDFYFYPANLTVASGTTVLWVNVGAAPHTVTAFDGSFDSGTLYPGDAFAVTFEGTETFWYFCALHPFMVGSVTVVEDDGGVAPVTFAEARAGGAVARVWGS